MRNTHLFKLGYGSKLSNLSQFSIANRKLLIKGLAQDFLDTYPAYRDEKNNSFFDMGDDCIVQLKNPYDLDFNHVLFWMAKALGIELSCGEVAQVRDLLIEYASVYGTPFVGGLIWDFDQEEV